MATLSQVSVLFSANTAQFLSGLTKMDVATKKWSKQIGRDFKAAGQDVAVVLKTMTVAYGAFATAVAAGTAKSVENISKIADEAEKMGASASRIMQLGAAAKMSGTDIETLKRGFTEIEKSLAEVDTGNLQTIRGFNELGISAKKLAALKPEDRFYAVVDALNKVKDPTDKARIGMQILGKSYVELTPLINMGVDGLNKMAAQASASGQALSDIDIARIKELGDNWERFKGKIEGLFNFLTGAVAEELNKKFEDFDRWTQEGSNGIKLLTDVMFGLATPIVVVIGAVETLAAGFKIGTAAMLRFTMMGVENYQAMVRPALALTDVYKNYFNAMVTGINAIIDGFNRFSKVKIPKISLKFDILANDKYLKELDDFKSDLWQEIAKLTEEASNLMNKGLSNQLEGTLGKLIQLINDVAVRAKEAADAAAAAYRNGKGGGAGSPSGNVQGFNPIPLSEANRRLYSGTGIAQRLREADEKRYKELEQFGQKYFLQQRKWDDEIYAIKDAHARGILTLLEKERALREISIQKYIETNGWIEGAATAMQSFADSMANAIVNGQSLGDVFKGLLKQIAAMVLRSLMLNIILSAIGLASPVAAGALANLMGMQNTFGGGKAKGGPVTAGMAYTVGEEGRERFVPATNGYIIPNSQVDGPRGGVTVVQNINVETGVSSTVRAEMMNMLPMFREQAVAGVMNATARGGSVAAKIRGF